MLFPLILKKILEIYHVLIWCLASSNRITTTRQTEVFQFVIEATSPTLNWMLSEPKWSGSSIEMYWIHQNQDWAVQ